MAKIVHSEAAPSEAVHYTFGGVEFDLGGSKAKTFETDDYSVISNAQAHPWLEVKYPNAKNAEGTFRDQLDPKDDPLSDVNSKANDPEAVKTAEEAKAEELGQRVALDAGKTQTVAVETAGVAETLAADDSSKTSDKKKDS